MAGAAQQHYEVMSHLGVHGTYSFVRPDLATRPVRELRD